MPDYITAIHDDSEYKLQRQRLRENQEYAKF